MREAVRKLDAELANPLLYRDATRSVSLSRERAALTRERDEIETRWLECSEQIEELRAAPDAV